MDDCYKDYDSKTKALMKADEEARALLSARKVLDPRLTGKMLTPAHYDAIRAYDAQLATEVIKILNANKPEMPDSSKSSYPVKPDNSKFSKKDDYQFARKPYAD